MPLVGLLCATVIAHEIRIAVIENQENTFRKQYTKDIAEIKEMLRHIDERVHDIEVQ